MKWSGKSALRNWLLTCEMDLEMSHNRSEQQHPNQKHCWGTPFELTGCLISISKQTTIFDEEKYSSSQRSSIEMVFRFNFSLSIRYNCLNKYVQTRINHSCIQCKWRWQMFVHKRIMWIDHWQAMRSLNSLSTPIAHHFLSIFQVLTRFVCVYKFTASAFHFPIDWNWYFLIFQFIFSSHLFEALKL